MGRKRKIVRTQQRTHQIRIPRIQSHRRLRDKSMQLTCLLEVGITELFVRSGALKKSVYWALITSPRPQTQQGALRISLLTSTSICWPLLITKWVFTMGLQARLKWQVDQLPFNVLWCLKFARLGTTCHSLNSMDAVTMAHL